MLMLLAVHTALCQTQPEPQTFTVGLRATVVRHPRSPTARPLSTTQSDEPDGAPGFVPVAQTAEVVGRADRDPTVRVVSAVVGDAEPPQVTVHLCADTAVELTVQLAVIEPSGRTSRQDVHTWMGSAGCIPVQATLWTVQEGAAYSVLGRVLGAQATEVFSVTSAAGVP